MQRQPPNPKIRRIKSNVTTPRPVTIHSSRRPVTSPPPPLKISSRKNYEHDSEQGSNFGDDFEDMENKVQKETEFIGKLIEQKLAILTESIKTHREDERLNEINKMFETHLQTINNTVNNSLDNHKYLYEKQDEDFKKKYQEMTSKYLEIRQKREEEFIKYSQLISQYQTIIAKICGSILVNHNHINKDEFEAMTNVMDKMGISETSIHSDEEPHIEKKEIPTTNSLAAKRFIRGISKELKLKDNATENTSSILTDRDSTLRQLLQSDDI